MKPTTDNKKPKQVDTSYPLLLEHAAVFHAKRLIFATVKLHTDKAISNVEMENIEKSLSWLSFQVNKLKKEREASE